MKNNLTVFQQFAVDAHAKTNHYYDGDLPYSFHLKMVANVAKRFEYVWYKAVYAKHHNLSIEAAFGHDLIEDARISYNDIRNVLKVESKHASDNADFIADIIYAVTNNKGRNRKERANESYYKGIRETPGAVFIKLCDRIANVKYGMISESSMFDKYWTEHADFLESLGLIKDTENTEETPEGLIYLDMIKELEYYFNL
jgi:(p)ppGpp synthase/HD superfamily hydrolase